MSSRCSGAFRWRYKALQRVSNDLAESHLKPGIALTMLRRMVYFSFTRKPPKVGKYQPRVWSSIWAPRLATLNKSCALHSLLHTLSGFSADKLLPACRLSRCSNHVLYRCISRFQLMMPMTTMEASILQIRCAAGMLSARVWNKMSGVKFDQFSVSQHPFTSRRMRTRDVLPCCGQN